MNNEIQIYENPNTFGVIEKAGAVFAKSGMFGCEKLEQGIVLAMICASERISPTQLCRTYHIIDGKLSKKSMAALAEFNARGGKHKWLKTGEEPSKSEDEREAVGEFTLDGVTVTARFSIGDARRAGIWRAKSAWEKQPANMLRARVASNAVGMLAPGIYAGDEGDSVPQPQERTLSLDPTPATTIEVETGSPESDFAPMKVEKPKIVEVASVTPAVAPVMVVAPPPTKPEPKSSALPEELCDQVRNAIGEHAIAAVKWMLKEKWLQPGQDIDALKPMQARRIIMQRDSFLRAIGEPK